MFFLPFASRMHWSESAEYRWQIHGSSLLYILEWTDVKLATKAQWEYKQGCAKEGRWDELVHTRPGAAEEGESPSSQWVKMEARLGSLV